MSITLEDIVAGRLIDGRNGIELERVFLVEGVTGAGAGKFANAARASGIPKRGERHPDDGRLFVLDVEVTPTNKDPSIFRVSCRYGDERASGSTPGANTRAGAPEFFADVITEETTEDIFGNKLVTAYTGHLPELTQATNAQGDTVSIPEQTISLVTRSHRVQLDKPTVGVRLTRLEDAIPRALIFDMVGAVNQTTWAGFPSRTWLCRGANVRQTAEGFEAVYTFGYNPRTWRATLTTQVGADIPDDVVDGNGVQTFDVYPLYDFAASGLGF